MKTDIKKSKSLALEGSPLRLNELQNEITKAEKGPFYTPAQAKKLLLSWRKKKSSL
jgi:hypothetical protein